MVVVSRIGVPSGDLDVAERHSGVERGHDEGGPQHVGVHQTESCSFADGANPAVRRTPVQAFAVVAVQDGPLGSFPDGLVYGAGHPRDQWDQRRLVALPDDA